ncbi:MAG: hypothetical protein J5819_05915 [Eubacterium sp.]|nr:hypothetical protein [Eubacterium sp.]
MPWNTVDSITMAPRSLDAGDQMGRDIHQHQHTIDQMAAQAQANIEQKAQHTVETQRSETEEYDMDQGSGGGAAGGNSNRKKKEKKDEAPMAPKSDSKFDIMI